MKVIGSTNAVVFALIIGIGSLAAIVPLGYAQTRIVDFVSAGGPDVQDADIPGSRPGFDKNYSLFALKYEDGSVRGRLIDRWSGGGGMGLRAEIDCVHVAGNTAWLSGVVTQGQTSDEEGNIIELAGYYVRTTVQDNGPNADPSMPDRVGISQVRLSAPFDCSLMRGALFDMPDGQVTVR